MQRRQTDQQCAAIRYSTVIRESSHAGITCASKAQENKLAPMGATPLPVSQYLQTRHSDAWRHFGESEQLLLTLRPAERLCPSPQPSPRQSGEREKRAPCSHAIALPLVGPLSEGITYGKLNSLVCFKSGSEAAISGSSAARFHSNEAIVSAGMYSARARSRPRRIHHAEFPTTPRAGAGRTIFPIRIASA